VNLAAAESSGSSTLLPVLLLVGLFALMYFMVIRPQSQRRKQMQQMQQAIEPGTKVITIGGLYGTVVEIDEDAVTLEVAPGVTNRYARAAIGKVLPDDEVEDAANAEDDEVDGDAVADSETPSSGNSRTGGDSR
jgi:preprotein translocase subunit YajC